MQPKAVISSYNNGLSMMDIAVKSGISTRKIRYILMNNGVKIRTHSEANYIKANPNGDPFEILNVLSPEEEHLKAMALGLFLTQGNLKNKNSVKFSNSNPGIVKIFVKFLKIVCGIPSDKIKASIIIYPDVNAKKCKQYWSDFLDLPLEQFTKTTILNARNKVSTKKHSDIGTATVYVHNKKLLNIIKEWAKEYSYVAQIVEH